MSLVRSLFISLLIIMLFWAIAFFQSGIAQAINLKSKQDTNQQSELQNQQKPSNKLPAANQQLTQISGVQQRIKLDNIEQFWDEFKNHSALHEQLNQLPSKIYVVYQALSKDFSQADVTIGYNVNELSQFSTYLSIDSNNEVQLLPLNKYDAKQLASAWTKLNYNAPIDYILEVHTLSPEGSVAKSQVSVSYK